jgi:SAM-dependent methyltransferase
MAEKTCRDEGGGTDLQSIITQSYDRSAALYEQNPAHGIPAEDEGLWLQLLADSLSLQSGQAVLDVGSGTGVLTRLVARTGATVTGLEPSRGMIEKAQANAVPAQAEVTYVKGDTHEPFTFGQGSFDAIVSRQAICYFRHPLLAFANWRHWLKPNGRALVVDGLWERAGWNNDALVDRLPLSCLQTTATVPYLMGNAGFRVQQVFMLDALNAILRERRGKQSSLYAVAALS